MTKALFRKQMMEVFSWVYQDRKSGKNRSKGGIVGFALIYLVLFGFLGLIFYQAAAMLCAPLISANLGWLFFALMGLVAVMLGVFGSVFNTCASLYKAKDNDLLLSLPIPTAKILSARLFGVYAMGLMYELIVMLPTLLVYFMCAPLNAASVIFSLLIPFVLSVFVLTLSCILGWVVALVSGKLKHKNIVTVVLSLVFIALYYYCYSQAYTMLQSILANPQKVGDSIKGALYPFYHMGLAAEGNALSMLLFTGITAALFFAVYAILSRSFLKLATANRGEAKMKYKEKAVKTGSAESALFDKEMKRFLASPVYMLNCGLGTVIMPIAAVALLIKGDALMEMLNGVFAEALDFLPLLAVAAICMCATMNDLTAPSVSLEGKSLWLSQALPVPPWSVLKAKLKLHLLLTEVPVLLLVLAVEIVLKPTVGFAVLLPIVGALFVLFMALVGLALNLKMPNLTWTNETVPVKQGMSVMITLFGGWAVVIALGLLYLGLAKVISSLVFLAAVTALLAILSAVLYRWMQAKGAKIFAAL